MNQHLLVLFVALIGIVASQKYTTKYDNVDLDQIIKSDRLMKNYIDCVLERGNCTPDGLELKKNIPDALLTDCSKCSDTQKNGSRRILKHLVQNKRSWFDELAAKYDPDNAYRKRNEQEFAKEGIVF
ncbi:ejaculatory bulb-specific protein 3 [Anoplophora glabripennis]|uniref:Ejaculatory bulb-specific protein 3 n=1 Tax=Anoplophora glabripennis TaxID=217634 RepID=V5FZA5_ANOGL|nr:ejaculatory bulb-specific protein 3 [Anoplophora glabripennis]